MPAVHIRPGTLQDLDTLVRYSLLLAKESEEISLDRKTLTLGIQAALEDTTKAQYFVAEVEGPDGTMDIAGQLMLTFEWSDWRNGMFLWIQSVYVAAHHRRKGVFRALYAHVTEMAASPSYCGVRLYVHEDNPSAQETYLKLGMLDAGYTILETPESFLPTNEPDPAPSLSRT